MPTSILLHAGCRPSHQALDDDGFITIADGFAETKKAPQSGAFSEFMFCPVSRG
jgi:hypothetical protein